MTSLETITQLVVLSDTEIARLFIDMVDSPEYDTDDTLIAWCDHLTFRVHYRVNTDLEYCGSNDPDDNEQRRTYDCEISKIELLDEDCELLLDDVSKDVPIAFVSLLSTFIEAMAELCDDYFEQHDYSGDE